MAIVISGVNNNDKITAADGLIDILSGVSFASTITAPGFSATNNLTAASINVGSNIQLGNAGVVTATSFSGDGSGLSNLPAGAPVGGASTNTVFFENDTTCLLYTSPSPRDMRRSRMPSSA